MAEWAVNTQPLDVTNVTIELANGNKDLIVKNNGVAFDAIPINGSSMFMEVIGGQLFRRSAAANSLTAWTTTADTDSTAGISLDIKSTGMQGGSTRWFFIIGEGDIRNGLTMQMHSIDNRRVELKSNRGVLEVTRH
ncbi:MAG: hypothetical protein AAF502_19550 [Bacteroidota bacterium]